MADCLCAREVIAEYLAHGYILKDNILHRAAKLDGKSLPSNEIESHWDTDSVTEEKNISPRFLKFLRGWDESIGTRFLGPDKTVSGHVAGLANTATGKAREFDQQKGISQSAFAVSFVPLDSDKVISQSHDP